MPEITISLKFSSVQAAAEYLSRHDQSHPISVTAAPTPAELAPAAPVIATIAPVATTAVPPVASPAPAPVTSMPPVATPAPAATTAPMAPETGVTEEQVRKALTDYVGRGQGRTAATARAIFAEAGVAGVKGANPQQLVWLLNAFQSR